MKQMTLEQIGRTAHEINESNGWTGFARSDWPKDRIETTKIHALGMHMALVHSEVSEATEAIRHFDRNNFDEELADVIIRVASIAHELGTDLEAAVWAKLQANATRGLHHGGKAV